MSQISFANMQFINPHFISYLMATKIEILFNLRGKYFFFFQLYMKNNLCITKVITKISKTKNKIKVLKELKNLL